MEQLRLVQPTIELKSRYEEMMDEWECVGGRINPGALRRYSKPLGRNVEYEHWLGWMEEDWQATQRLYFLMCGERILGAISLRYKSAGVDGHIGFGIRPSERRKDNVGSAKTIQKNGGMLIEEVEDDGELVQVYQIDLAERKRHVKAIIVDLDRTLLHTDKSISEYTLNVLKKCHEKGILIMAATARPERSIITYHEQIHFDAMTVMNGTGVVLPGTAQQEKTQGNDIPKASAKEILQKLCGLPDIILSLEMGNEVYANVEIPEWEAIVYHDFPKLPAEGPIYKILVSRPNENIGPLVETLLTEDTYCTVAGNNLVQIMSRKATKWNGIQLMLTACGIAPADAVYFGDDNDDIESLRNCGTGVAVSNAIEAAKEAADAVTESNDEDGVAKYIEREIL